MEWWEEVSQAALERQSGAEKPEGVGTLVSRLPTPPGAVAPAAHPSKRAGARACRGIRTGFISAQIERRPERQLVGGLWHPHDLRGEAKQAVVVIVHSVEVQPHHRLGESLDRRQIEELGSAEMLNAD